MPFFLRFHYFIKTRQRGSRDEIAYRLGVGKNKLTDLRQLLINHGAEIEYNRDLGCYQYLNEFEFFVGPVRARDVARKREEAEEAYSYAS